ncbi:hypothetical protein ACOME3_000461 [Neoechinorhynchus agilis]
MPNFVGKQRRRRSKSWLPMYIRSQVRRLINRQKSLLAARSKMIPFGFEYSGLTFGLRLVSFNLLVYNRDRFGLESETIVMQSVAPRLSRINRILRDELIFPRPTRTPFMRTSQCLERILIPEAVIEKSCSIKRNLEDSQVEGNLQETKAESKVFFSRKRRKINTNATNNSVIFNTMSSDFNIAYLEQLGKVGNAPPIKWAVYHQEQQEAVTSDFSQFAVPTKLEVVANFASNSQAYKFKQMLRSTGIDECARLSRWRRRDDDAYKANQ